MGGIKQLERMPVRKLHGEDHAPEMDVKSFRLRKKSFLTRKMGQSPTTVGSRSH